MCAYTTHTTEPRRLGLGICNLRNFCYSSQDFLHHPLLYILPPLVYFFTLDFARLLCWPLTTPSSLLAYSHFLTQNELLDHIWPGQIRACVEKHGESKQTHLSISLLLSLSLFSLSLYLFSFLFFLSLFSLSLSLSLFFSLLSL